ncbi:hypothetical protein [Bosea sp. TAF32]|uniref:hypothetical protein n=1 Tax=Bosea sp. TAF32 TaxID=3237482 RepID=UPI003F907CB4
MNPFNPYFNNRNPAFNRPRMQSPSDPAIPPEPLRIDLPWIPPAQAPSPPMLDPDRMRRDGPFAPNPQPDEGGNPLIVNVRKRPPNPTFTSAPAAAPQAAPAPAPALPKPDWETFQAEDDMGRGIWQTRPAGYQGAMGGQHQPGQYWNTPVIPGFKNPAAQALASQFNGGTGVNDFGTPQQLQTASLPDGSSVPLPPSRPNDLNVNTPVGGQGGQGQGGPGFNIDPNSTVGGMMRAFGAGGAGGTQTSAFDWLKGLFGGAG